MSPPKKSLAVKSSQLTGLLCGVWTNGRRIKWMSWSVAEVAPVRPSCLLPKGLEEWLSSIPRLAGAWNCREISTGKCSSNQGCDCFRTGKHVTDAWWPLKGCLNITPCAYVGVPNDEVKNEKSVCLHQTKCSVLKALGKPRQQKTPDRRRVTSP